MSSNPVLNSAQLILIQWNLLSQSEQVRFGLDALCLAGFLGDVEVAARASHPMWALVEEVIGAIAVTEVLEFPWLIGWSSASNGILVDENLDCSQVSGEVSSILVGLCEFRRCDLCVMAG